MASEPRNTGGPNEGRTTETVTTFPARNGPGIEPIAPTDAPITGRGRGVMKWVWIALAALLVLLLLAWLLGWFEGGDAVTGTTGVTTGDADSIGLTSRPPAEPAG